MCAVAAVYFLAMHCLFADRVVTGRVLEVTKGKLATGARVTLVQVQSKDQYHYLGFDSDMSALTKGDTVEVVHSATEIVARTEKVSDKVIQWWKIKSYKVIK